MARKTRWTLVRWRMSCRNSGRSLDAFIPVDSRQEVLDAYVYRPAHKGDLGGGAEDSPKKRPSLSPCNAGGGL